MKRLKGIIDMKSLQWILILLAFVFSGCFGNYTQDLQQAKQAYEQEDYDMAKKFYLKAAQKGSPEAYFVLAYRFDVALDRHIYYLLEAAKRGHDEALADVMDELVFRAHSLSRANPQKAFEIYKKAKKANSKIKLYDEERVIKTIQMILEAGPFDWKAFCKKYNVEPHSDENAYHVWELAEEASRGGRFGNPDPKLVFQLVSRGGWVPAELEAAVEDVYKNWKSGIVKEFNICDFITSGGGGLFCASREDEQDEKERNKKLLAIRQKLKAKNHQLLDVAYVSAVKFIESRACDEENFGGTARSAFIIESQMKQKNAYLNLIERIRSGHKPFLKNTFEDADRKLNKTYNKVIIYLKKNTDKCRLPRADEVREVQRLWITYRDNTAKLFVAINSQFSEDDWKSWLTEVREEQLKDIIDDPMCF